MKQKTYDDPFDIEQDTTIKKKQEQERKEAEKRYAEFTSSLVSFIKCIFFGVILIYIGVYPHTTGILTTLPEYWWQTASLFSGIIIGIGLTLIISGIARLFFGHRLFS